MPNLTRRLLIVTLVVFLMAGLGISGFWVYGAERLRANLALWTDAWRAEGNSVTYRPLAVRGFPVFFRTTLESFIIGGGGRATPWRWEAPAIELRASPFAPNRARADFSGSHKVTATVFDAPLSFVATTKGGTGRVQRRGDRYEGSLELDAGSLTIEGISGAFTLKEAILNAYHTREPVDHTSPSAGLKVTVDDLVLPGNILPGPLGDRIDALSLEAEVMGAIGPAVDRATIAAWRDAGGTVEVERVTLRWGPLRLRAEGTVALDADLQPLAAFTATMTGFSETLDLLVAQEALSAQDAAAAKTLLTLLARTPITGGAPEIAVPLTIQNRRLSVGPVPLLTLPAIVWPAS